jgi:hypothetical protein
MAVKAAGPSRVSRETSGGPTSGRGRRGFALRRHGPAAGRRGNASRLSQWLGPTRPFSPGRAGTRAGTNFATHFLPIRGHHLDEEQCDSRLHGLSKEMTPLETAEKVEVFDVSQKPRLFQQSPLGVCPRPIPTRRGVPGNRGVSELEGKAEPTCQPHTAGGGPGKVGRVPSEAPLRKVAASGCYGAVGPGARGLVPPPRRTPQPGVENEPTPTASRSCGTK